jgi:hypothetical protein
MVADILKVVSVYSYTAVAAKVPDYQFSNQALIQ